MSFSILKTFLRLIGYHDKYQNRQDHNYNGCRQSWRSAATLGSVAKQYNINSISMPMIVIPHTEYSLFIK